MWGLAESGETVPFWAGQYLEIVMDSPLCGTFKGKATNPGPASLPPLPGSPGTTIPLLQSSRSRYQTARDSIYAPKLLKLIKLANPKRTYALCVPSYKNHKKAPAHISQLLLPPDQPWCFLMWLPVAPSAASS